MIRLLYCSQAKSDLNPEEVKQILLKSRKNNKPDEITGVLVHGGGLFVQLLEGPEQAVMRRYVKILDDKRHKDSRIIHITPAKERLFENWTMGIIERDPLEFEQIAKIRAHRLESVNAQAFARVMREFNDLLMQTT